jgi:hypothetical protein
MELKEVGKRELAEQYNIPEEYLRYIGPTDCSMLAGGGKLHQYNIHLKGHPNDKSTVAYRQKEVQNG